MAEVEKKKEKTFSEEQLSAINTRGRTLLVSAAAGSGKTTTLTERIIRSLLADRDPESLTEMLIVTFTNASVADMREKISSALAAALDGIREEETVTHTDDEARVLREKKSRLERELHMLPSARICTIDSFCNEVLRRNAEYAGITPGYRIAETAEAALLATAILDNLISSVYEGEFPEIASPLEFEELCDCLTSSKSTGDLAEILRKLYQKSTSAVDGIKMFARLIDIYQREGELPPEKTVYGKDLMRHFHDTLSHSAITLRRLCSSFDCPEYESTLLDDAERLERINEADTYEGARALLSSVQFPNLPTLKEKREETVFASERRKKIKDSLGDLYTKFFSYTVPEWQTLYSELFRILTVLKNFLEKFDGLYTAEKIRRGMLEYSDIERLALKCLYNDDGTVSDIAKGYRDSFTSVYIDEYQDVNELQNAIFEAISKDNNRFMVGDIKQSIYSFRSARPEIFARMKTTFPPLKSDTGSPSASIFMSNNYRCDEVIVDFVNAVFDTAFTLARESIGYVDGDRLKFAKVYTDKEPPEAKKVEIAIFPGPKRGKKKENEEEDEELAALTEAEWIAERIEALLKDGTDQYKPSDIAILLRKNKSIDTFAAALSARGIPCVSKDSEDFFLNAEVLLALCLLNAIDNPSRDIYLAGLMCSPLYGFSPDDLVKIRRTGTGGRLYADVKAYSESHPEDGKIARFLRELLRYRTLSEGMTADAMLSRLYRETGLLALASKHGGDKNLMLLYNYARKFEGSSYKGLYSFISYINRLIEEKQKFDGGADGISDENAVKILTVHSSKGLEYPVVFFAEAGKPFKNLDKTSRIAYSEDYGLSLYLRVQDGLALVRNPVQHTVHENMDKRFIEEELRVLYVALTRARERLFITGAADGNIDGYMNKIRLMRETRSRYQQIKCGSFLSLILTSIKDSDADIRFIEPLINDNEEELENKQTESRESRTSDKNNEERITALLRSRFNYKYPHAAETALPEKLSVSYLTPRVLDGSDTGEDLEAKSGTSAKENKKSIIPSFYSGKRDDEAALCGVATHTVLQFCDFENLKKSGTDAEISRLVMGGFITERDSERVNKAEIEKFRQSNLLCRMMSAELYREFRFNCRMPAELFTEEKEKARALNECELLVQGVIDCLLIEADGSITLIDYKTDRLTEKELLDRTLARKKLFERHGNQLYYYSVAIKKIFGKAPASVGIYSLPLGEFLEMEI